MKTRDDAAVTLRLEAWLVIYLIVVPGNGSVFGGKKRTAVLTALARAILAYEVSNESLWQGGPWQLCKGGLTRKSVDARRICDATSGRQRYPVIWATLVREKLWRLSPLDTFFLHIKGWTNKISTQLASFRCQWTTAVWSLCAPVSNADIPSGNTDGL